jgi:DNA-binding transcriptional MerR regulator
MNTRSTIFFDRIGSSPMPANRCSPTPPTGNPEFPNKLYFRIGEVARLAGVKPYVLRFWETEFSGLGPAKAGTGHRLYRRKDVELVLEIKRLLYENRYTIEGARKYLSRKPKNASSSPPAPPAFVQRELFPEHENVYEGLRRELSQIVTLLSRPIGKA